MDRKPTGKKPMDRKPTGKRPVSRKPAGKKPSPGKPQERKAPRTGKDTPSRRTTPPGRQRQGARRPRTLAAPRHRKRAYHLVVNQLAGQDRQLPLKLAGKLENRLKHHDWNCFIHAASTWEEFKQGIRAALRDRPYAVMVIGGDGSVREAASRVARAKGLLGIIPCGRYNNIFRSLYGHTDIMEALELARFEYQIRIDAGLANGRFFLGSLITGLVPVMLERLGNKSLPRLAMTWSKLAARAADDTMPLTTTMKVDSYSFKSQPLVLNIHLLSHLMSLRFAPVAVPDDGRLVLVYDSDGVRDAVVHYIRDLKKDRYQYNDGIQILRGEKISITPAAGRRWMIDGDIIEFSGEEIHVEVLPRILRVFSNAPEK